MGKAPGQTTLNRPSQASRIGKIREDGLIDTISATPGPVEPDPYLKTYPWAKEFWPKA